MEDVSIKDQIKSLLRNRSRILGELASLRTNINLIKTKQQIVHDDHDSYQRERGGDAKLVHLDINNTEPIVIVSDQNNKLNVISTGDDDFLTNEQRERRSIRREMMKTETKEKTKDAAVFSQDRQLKPVLINKNDIAVVGDEDFRMSWNKLAQDEDELCFLDVDTLEDLFEDGGMLLSDADAINCLQTVATNQLGKFKSADILAWSEQHQLQKLAASKTSGWTRFGSSVRKAFDEFFVMYDDVIEKFNTQKLVTEIASEVSNKSKASQMSGDKIMGDMKGTVRLAAWQRQQMLMPPSSIALKAEFGPEIKKKEELKGVLGASTSSQINLSPTKPTQTNKKRDQHQNSSQFKLRLKLEGFSKPPTQEKREPLDPKTKNVLTELGNIEPATFLNRYTYVRKGLVETSESFGTVSWIGFEVNPEVSFEQATLLLQTAKNFFNSIPWDARSDIFTEVEGEVFTLEQPIEDNDEVIIRRSFHVIVALLHEMNVTTILEEKMPAGLLLTRALRNLKVELRCTDSLFDMYKAAIPHENVQERLFGPQEDELGEEGMNPIRFAKMCRQRKQAALNAVEKAATMSIPELKKHCQMRGILDTGKPTDLVERVKKAFKKQAEIIGFGELSAFGAESVGNIMRHFNDDKDKTSIGFWELNKLLEATGTETIYDLEEYKNILSSQCLAINKDGELTEDGLVAYYELFGRLTDDIVKVGLGSLDKQLKGDIAVSAQYDTEAISTLMELFEPHTTTHRFFKVVVSMLSSMQTISFDSKYEHLSHILKLFDPVLTLTSATLMDLLCKPGYLATMIHTVAEFLADGEAGLVRTLRKDVLEEFGKYDKWFSTFADSLSSEPEPEPETSFVEGEGGGGSEGVGGGEKKSMSEEEIEQLVSFVQSMLPSVPKSREFSTGIIRKLRQTIERIDDITSQEQGVKLSQQQRDRMKETKKLSKEKIIFIEKSMKENVKLNAAHACSFYDAVSMYAKGVSTFGWGTQHHCIRATFTGLDFVQFLLPPALGERSKIKEMKEEKLRRANQRKNAALAALEREKNRRNLDPAEKERLAQEKAHLLALKREKEEVSLFQEAFQALQFAREERKSNSELHDVVDLFERVLALKKNRYPNSIQATVAESNFACAILELLGYTHNRRDVMIKAMESATEHCVKYIDKHFKVYREEVERELRGDTALDEEVVGMSEESKAFEENIGPCIVIIQNYLSMMKGGKNMNTNFLDKEVDKMKFTVLTMFECLSERDQEMVAVGACREVNGMPLLIVGDISANLNLTIADGKYLRGDKDPSDDDAGDLSTVLEEKSLQESAEEKEEKELDEKELRKLKYARQRELDKQKRISTIRERHKLYHLIHSGEITAMFHEKAKQQHGTSSGFTFASSDRDSVDPYALKSIDDSQTLASTLDQSSIITFEGGGGSPDERFYNEVQSFDESTVAGGMEGGSPLSSVVMSPPLLLQKRNKVKSIDDIYKEAEEKQRRDANPLMQTVSVQEISVSDLYDSGNFMDKQDPGVTIIIGNHILKTERVKEAGVAAKFPEKFTDIQLVAEKVGAMDIEVEVGNIDAKGNTKTPLGFAKIKVVEAIKKKNTWVDVTLNLVRPSQGQVMFKAMISDVHELEGYPNIHIYNSSVENRNRQYKKKGEGGSGVVNMLRKIKEAVLDM